MRHKLLIVFFLFFTLLLSACGIKENEFFLNRVEEKQFNVGEVLPFTNIVFTDTGIISGKDGSYYCVQEGYAYIECDEGAFFIKIVNEILRIEATANQQLMIGESVFISTSVIPLTSNQSVTYKSTDESIIIVNQQGKVTACNYGLARVIIVANENDKIRKELTFLVSEEDERNYDRIIQNIIRDNEELIYLDGISGILKPLIESNVASIIGVSSYNQVGGVIANTNFASGVVYRCDIVLRNGDLIERVEDVSKYQNIQKFKYYVITNRRVIENYNLLKVYISPQYDEINATLIQYDDKIDLAVLSFETELFIPTVKLGDSANVEAGEFILAIGNAKGKLYFRTSVFGIVSHANRYISDDTDGDGVGDWDAQYIQHDASLNDGDSGGALINLQGEVIAINTTKISVTAYNNMSFAIPINLVMEIVKQLENGISPQRAILGVEILDVKAYHENPDYYKIYYPGVVIDSNIKYGFYINKITTGGVAEKAKVQVGDILVEFNSQEIKYSYQVRAELGKFLIGSGETATLKVIRNGIVVELTVTF